MNGAKGMSALQLGRDLEVQYNTAFVLAHKLRKAMAADHAGLTLKGDVEVDGAYFGGYAKPENRKEDRKDRRLAENQTGKRRVAVVMRERGGRTLPFVFNAEADAVAAIRIRVATGTTVYADEAAGWDALHAEYDVKRINHSIALLDNGACTNQAESFFSRLRRAEIGQHRAISRQYLAAYAGEMAWREDNRREATGEQFRGAVSAALGCGVSGQWKCYWQRG